MDFNQNPFLNQLEKSLQHDLREALNQEELLWHQKSRMQWLKDGDQNTKFYHAKMIIKRHHNKVLCLHDSNNVWVDDEKILTVMVKKIFMLIYLQKRSLVLSSKDKSELFQNLAYGPK